MPVLGPPFLSADEAVLGHLRRAARANSAGLAETGFVRRCSDESGNVAVHDVHILWQRETTFCSLEL